MRFLASGGMARPIRFQYPGAIYHVIARGDGGKVVFETDDDRKSFVFRLGQVCASHGWRVHAWVLMGNHFHLLLETPQANRVTGMQWLLGTFSQGWNRARLRRGHVFQGRYKSVPVTGTDADAYYFRIVADTTHLNPARAGLAGGEIDEEATAAIRRGWYLGKETFKDWLLKLLEKTGKTSGSTRNRTGEALREQGEAEAGRIVRPVQMMSMASMGRSASNAGDRQGPLGGARPHLG
jgi:REP element-mobilizing transposase RayT